MPGLEGITMRVLILTAAAWSLALFSVADAQSLDIRNKTVIATGQSGVKYAFIAPSGRVFLGGYRADVGPSAMEARTGTEYEIGKTIHHTALQYTVAGKALKCAVTTNAQLSGNVLTLTVVSSVCENLPKAVSYSNTIEFDGDTCKWRLQLLGDQVVRPSCKVVEGRQVP
jgi:hypothetical protein